MPRGGRRLGTPGAQYTNRSDLATGPRQLPAQAATNQPYGVAGQQLASQKQVPLATGPALPAPPSAAAAGGGAPSGFVQPPPLLGPTERPNEPVTAGSPSGPGPGPQSPGLAPPGPLQQAAAVLNRLSDDQISTELRLVKQKINAAAGNQGAY